MNKDISQQSLKCFEVRRKVLEVFQVYAHNKIDAARYATDPHTVTVIKETVKLKP